MAVTSVDNESSIRPVEESGVKNEKIREEDIEKRTPPPEENTGTEVLPTAPDYMGKNIDTNA